MKILFVGVFNERSTNVSQVASLRNQGSTVDSFDYRIVREKYSNEQMQKAIVYGAGMCDLVLFSKCNRVDSWVVDECNKKTKTALWYMDPLNGNFDSELIDKIKKCNYTFCALNKPYLEAMKYSSNVHFIHEGFNSDVDFPTALDVVKKPYKVAFIGNLTGERKKYHQEIGFKNFTDCFGLDHSKTVGKSKINLNFVQNDSGCSDRVYKILAAKGFLLTQPWPGMEKDFTPDKDLVVFNGIGDLINKIDTWSSPDAEFNRMKIAEHGCQTVQKFSRDNWAKKILDIIEGK